jgi:hypothetical protein
MFYQEQYRCKNIWMHCYKPWWMDDVCQHLQCLPMLASFSQCLPIFTNAYKCSPRILFGLCQFLEPNFSSHKKVGATNNIFACQDQFSTKTNKLLVRK